MVDCLENSVADVLLLMGRIGWMVVLLSSCSCSCMCCCCIICCCRLCFSCDACCWLLLRLSNKCCCFCCCLLRLADQGDMLDGMKML